MSELSPVATPVMASWIASQTRQLLSQKGHAWLLQGPSGLGQYSLGLSLVRSWLCENPLAQGACGLCTSCHAIDVRTHADLCVLMPETTQLELGWPLSEKAQAEIDDKKRKPSREIRVESMRDAIEFSQRTSARGRGKAVLVYPAERMNPISANALLKTLEEPSGDTRFVLASEAAHQLLPTIRSRCIAHTMLWPEVADSLAWLQTMGMSGADAATLLQASGGRPEDAMLFAQTGRDPQRWKAIPRAVASGDVSIFKDWPVPQVIDALHRLCHDLMALSCGASPRFFEVTDLPAKSALADLSAWSRDLAQSSRTAEHPFNAGLMMEDLVNRAQTALKFKSGASGL
jgi:DNA polymerase-3 subunit delta'